jgi:hypothetical protein
MSVPRVVDLPSRGKLLIGTDLQGNLHDFERMSELFREAQREEDETYLVLTGDLVHGPELPREAWPEHLGSYYLGASAAVLERARDLQDRHPGRVIYLLGNHEHAHVGGPVVGKFFTDEAARLEQILGADRTEAMRAWMATWPLVALAPRAQLCLLHGAPHAVIRDRTDIDSVDLDGLVNLEPEDVPHRTVLGAILWARNTSRARARAFLKALGSSLTTAIHGHDVVREGFSVEDPTHICVSTSFGCHDGDKLYVEWDLSEPAISAYDVARRGLRRLWPDARPVYLDDTLR